MFEEIPLKRPETPLLDQIVHPDDLRLIGENKLDQLAYELRHFLLTLSGKQAVILVPALV